MHVLRRHTELRGEYVTRVDDGLRCLIEGVLAILVDGNRRMELDGIVRLSRCAVDGVMLDGCRGEGSCGVATLGDTLLAGLLHIAQ